MKIRTLLIILLLITPSLASADLIGGIRSALPPKYLRVPLWKKCAASITCGSAQFVCLPKLKPAFCPYLSWRRLKKKHLIPDCTEGCKGLGY